MPTALERLETLAEGLTAKQSSHLSFADACGAFVAIRRGFSQTLVGKAFGISQSGVSKLASCLNNPRRYASVAAEFRRLGEQAFRETYFTDDIADRIARFRVGVPVQGDMRRGRAPNPAAAENAGLWLMDDDHGDEHTVEVLWIDHEGWRHREFGRWAYISRGIYETSTKAREAAYANYLASGQERRRA